ncbi:hypothetical protein AD940_15205 [Gluconobacter thailandicus]|nr:hypothetical protein AD940_15205 [Gluconobacter thailandicus]
MFLFFPMLPDMRCRRAGQGLIAKADTPWLQYIKKFDLLRYPVGRGERGANGLRFPAHNFMRGVFSRKRTNLKPCGKPLDFVKARGKTFFNREAGYVPVVIFSGKGNLSTASRRYEGGAFAW